MHTVSDSRFQNYCVAVSVGHLLETTVAVLVGVLEKIFGLTLNADGFKVVELVVGKGILHSVDARDFGHIVKSVIGVGDVGKCVNQYAVLSCAIKTALKT